VEAPEPEVAEAAAVPEPEAAAVEAPGAELGEALAAEPEVEELEQAAALAPGTCWPGPVRPQQHHAGCCRSGQPAECSCTCWRRYDPERQPPLAAAPKGQVGRIEHERFS